MLRYIDSKKMGRANHGWLDSHFHFSFDQYYNPKNMQFGALRVLNDDTVQPGEGFGTHPHKNMEIISYVVDGELTHADSMKNEETLARGMAQYMSAGTGVKHSEFNNGEGVLRFLQIWILPDADGYKPNYGSVRFEFSEREGKWLPIAAQYGDEKSSAPIRVHADINMSATFIRNEESAAFKVASNRQAYFVLIEGKADIGGIKMIERDALASTGEDVRITPDGLAHVLAIEMARA
ncbi:MAG: pirin family protein [Synergistaceae bacterium]|jgi:redox-sensitive bicupin YhaK (pirin superfamily)|nr:pirin family protein [Synergistaceae bacterium]